MGEFCPLRISLDSLGTAGSPTDTMRKNSALPPVTSEMPIIFVWGTKACHIMKKTPYMLREAGKESQLDFRWVFSKKKPHTVRLNFVPLSKTFDLG